MRALMERTQCIVVPKIYKEMRHGKSMQQKRGHAASQSTLVIVLSVAIVLVLLVGGYLIVFQSSTGNVSAEYVGIPDAFYRLCAFAVKQQQTDKYCTFSEVSIGDHQEYLNCEDARVGLILLSKLHCPRVGDQSPEEAACDALIAKLPGESGSKNCGALMPVNGKGCGFEILQLKNLAQCAIG